eukprot:jgi/Tetstr1/452285/TSEL_039321.t1
MKQAINWDDQRIFLAVLEEGSLSGAARRLGLSHPTVRSRIEALEADLGTLLFTRSMTGLTPTEAAEALREPARAMATASEVFVRRASAPEGAIAGAVRLSVPEFMGIEVVPAMLEPLRIAHPSIRIELSLSNLPADLMAQEVDLAPLDPDQLAAHDIIGPDRNVSDLALAGQMLASVDVARLVLRTDSHPAQLAAARAGLGIALAQVPVGNADPDLTRILPDFSPGDIHTWIVTHENLARVPRVRAVFDALVTGFRAMMRTPI